MEHRFEFKIYYEDTDSLGLVYYANYLRYLERARTELVAAEGKPIQQWNAEGYNFAVYEVKIRYLKPARLGDVCEVVTKPTGGTEYRRTLAQNVVRGDETITRATVHLVCLDDRLELTEFPPGIFD
ncbi:MAG: YbgC/FadM family acyl-CoA thioesterase [bacterium]